MAIEIPDDWPVRSWSEVTPLGHLDTLATDAPTGEAARRWDVSSWSSTREISSSLLPGQIRHRTGLSVGTGKALIRRDSADYPWRQRDVFELTGSNAQILIAPDGATKIPTGQFRVAPIEGDISTLGVAVDLDERQIAGTKSSPGILDLQWQGNITQAEVDSQPKDPAWFIAELAEQMGYTSGNMIPGGDGYTAPVLDVPFQGALAAQYPPNTRFSTTDTYAWGESDGSIGLVTEEDNNVRVTYGVGQAVPTVFTVTADTDNGTFSFLWVDTETTGNFQTQIRTYGGGDATVDLTVFSRGSNGVLNTTTTQSFEITRDPDRPNRIQIEVTFSVASDTGFNSASIRMRRQTSPWSAAHVHAMPNQLSRVNGHDIQLGVSEAGVQGTAFLSHVSVVDNVATPADVRDRLLTNTGGRNGRIYLEPLFGTIISPWLDPDLTVWGAMQAIVSAWQGALITDVYGDLHLLNRYSMTGVGTGAETPIDVGLTFEDLPWRMDYADQADRLVVKYRPVQLVTASVTTTTLPVVWELADLVQVPANGSRDVFFNLDYVYPVDLQLISFIQKGQPNAAFGHTWDAWTKSDGTGVHVTPNDQAAIRLDRVTSSTWKVFIRNLTGNTFYMVDETGTPYLKIRSSWYYDQTQELTIERGLSAGEATNAVEVDLSNYVQNETDANILADFLWARVNRRTWTAKTVKMVPDYRLDLGDVVEIFHERTQMRSNALVTKVELAGEAGSVTQQIDLVLIPDTWEDFDEQWGPNYHTSPPGSWNEFDALWAPYTWNDFDRTPTATTNAEIQEGM